MKKVFFRRSAALLLSLYTLLSCGSVTAAASASCGERPTEDGTIDQAAKYGEDTEATQPALSEGVQVGSRLWELLFGKKELPRELIVGGDVFGVRIKQNGVTVAESQGIPALRAGDRILSVEGKEINSIDEVKEIVSASRGESLTVRALHSGSEIKIEVRPQLIDGEYKLGVTLRDGAVGIGTVTFIDPNTGAFGGLGHGICDGETGEVIDMASGEVTGAILGGIHRGECGKPGELSGILTDKHLGELTKNCECGVFGILNKEAYEKRADRENGSSPKKPSAGKPTEGSEKGEETKGKPSSFGKYESKVIPVGTRAEVKEGAATIVSTLKNGKKAEYTIEIFDVDRSSCGSKSFRIRATDKALLALTGGIVRGMSGSPIIQDGKLVGAVTHVMVADPTEGYGIFIENMLSAAESQVMPKAA